MFIFYFENFEPFGPLKKNCPKLDQNKSIVSRFSIVVVCRSTVSTVHQSNYVGCFSFRQWMFVFADLLPDASIKSNKSVFSQLEKIFFNDFTFFSVK